ncbi:MAG: hypothetical protein FJ215_05610 [Ignavibacteria bacterium]|nr:hypothetical protein [Ignavibacteria bacterium]
MVARRARKLRRILLGEIDRVLTRSYRQTLAEVMNELYVRGTISSCDLSDDSIIRALSSSHLLDLSPTESLSQVRGALARLGAGRYGICMTCHRDIPFRDLHRQPTRSLCSACLTLPTLPPLKKHEKPRNDRHAAQ